MQPLPSSVAFWSTFRFAAGENGANRACRLFTAGLNMVGQGYHALLSLEDTNLYEQSRLPCDFYCTAVSWSVHGGDAASRAAFMRQSTWAWDIHPLLIPGSPLDTFMLNADPDLEASSPEEVAELIRLLRERNEALHGVYPYKEPFRIDVRTTFAISLHTGATPWVPPEDVYVRFTLHGCAYHFPWSLGLSTSGIQAGRDRRPRRVRARDRTE